MQKHCTQISLDKHCACLWQNRCLVLPVRLRTYTYSFIATPSPVCFLRRQEFPAADEVGAYPETFSDNRYQGILKP